MMVIQLFDREGYYSSVMAETDEGVHAAAEMKSSRVKGLVACSLPFLGKWDKPNTVMDVTLPPDFKEVLAEIDRPGAEDEP